MKIGPFKLPEFDSRVERHVRAYQSIGQESVSNVVSFCLFGDVPAAQVTTSCALFVLDAYSGISLSS